MTGSDGKFIVDANTGEIRTGPASLDREEKSLYRMTAVATDTGNKQVMKKFNRKFSDFPLKKDLH